MVYRDITYAEYKRRMQPALDCSSISDLRGDYIYGRLLKNYENTDVSGCVLLNCFPSGIPNTIEINPATQASDFAWEYPINFRGVTISNRGRNSAKSIRFTDFDFKNSSFFEAKCDLIEFANSDFAHADFRGATFKSCSFENCKLENADLRGAVFVNCNLEGAKLLNVKVDQKSQLFGLYSKTSVDEHTEIYIEDGTRLVNRVENYEDIAFSDSFVIKTFADEYGYTNEDFVEWDDHDSEDRSEALYQWLVANTKGFELIIETSDNDGW